VTELQDMKVASLRCLLACTGSVWSRDLGLTHRDDWTAHGESNTETTGLHTASLTFREDWTAQSESNIQRRLDCTKRD